MGDDEDQNHSFELFSNYYSNAKKIHDWLSFSNLNPTIDSETKQETFQIEQLGEFSLDTSKIEYIAELSEDERRDLFEFDVPKVFYIKTYPNESDIHIGLIG